MARKVQNAAVMAPADEGNGGVDAADTEGRRSRVITYVWNPETNSLDQFRNKVLAQSFPFSDLNDEIRDRAMRHGITQKLADSHAGKIPDAEKEARDTWEHLAAGQWFSARGETAERTSLFFEAYVRVMNSRGHAMTVEDFRKRVNDIESGDDDNKKRALKGARENVDIVAAMNEIRMERARAKSGAEAELAVL